jgi:hypothetical protein
LEEALCKMLFTYIQVQITFQILRQVLCPYNWLTDWLTDLVTEWLAACPTDQNSLEQIPSWEGNSQLSQKIPCL